MALVSSARNGDRNRYEGELELEPHEDALVFTVMRNPPRPELVNPDGVKVYAWPSISAANA